MARADTIITNDADWQMVRSLRDMLGAAAASMGLLEIRYPHLGDHCARLRGAALELHKILAEMKRLAEVQEQEDEWVPSAKAAD